MQPIVLASASPRRQEILTLAGLGFEVEVSDVEEIAPVDLDPEMQPRYFARLKAENVAHRLEERLSQSGQIVLGADTLVFLDGEVLGKPKDKRDARRMLNILSARTHTVITGCALVRVNTDHTLTVRVFEERSLVRFLDLSKEEIDGYLACGEYADKAGAYGIQGKACTLISGIDGDYFNVMGLPISRVVREIRLMED